METARPRFVLAARREPCDRTPIWIMRQAGRYLPEYREVRAQHTLLEICRDPALACEVSLQPLRRFDLDAAILFSDLVVPLAALGVEFDIVEGRGPVLARCVRDATEVARLRRPGDLGELAYVAEAIRLIRSGLKDRLPVLGFAGAPFTLASYLVEGGPSRDFRETKRFLYRDPRGWAELMERLADLVIAHLELQVAAGAAAVQVFDSWVGCLSPADYRAHVLPATRRVFDETASLGVPRIHFATGSATLLDLMAEAGGEVLGVDWRIPLGQVRARHPDRAVQGNLDPAALLGPPEALSERIDEVLDEASGAPGHIFNLGHGILPETPIESVQLLVERVGARTARA